MLNFNVFNVNVNVDIDACLKCVYRETRFILCAYWNKKELKTEMQKLTGKKERVLGPTPTSEVVENSWLHKVIQKENEVEELVRQRSCCTCCFVACNGRKISDLINDVRTLVSQRIEFDGYKTNLQIRMDELTRMQEVVEEIIDRQRRQQAGRECKVAVRSWLANVLEKKEEVNVNLRSVAETASWVATVNVLIEHIELLVNERRTFDDENLVEDIPDDPTDNIPDLEYMVGRNSKLSEIIGYVRDGSVKTIGIWGPGGIGKTTLLKSIKEELARNRDFFYIVLIELSSQNTVNIPDIQKQIAECISLPFQSENERGRARKLRNVLKREKTLILIDNVWNELDFEGIGIPFSERNDLLKIVLTTRYEGVCTEMRTQKIVNLDYLDYAESLKLFQKISSHRVDLKNQIVRQRVNEILKKCGGLPLVIRTVARAVANYDRVGQWDHAVDCLRNGTMDNVMRCLKFSYDKLENDDIRSCLLYFSLYPEGCIIETDQLIKEWIGEGFLGLDLHTFKSSYNTGHDYINKLKSFCLVESGFAYYQVKVHDVIREMLCWISKNERKEVFLVYNKNHDDVSNHNDWHLAKGIYLNERQLKCTLPEEGTASCPNLTSVIVQPNYSHLIVKLPTQDFFRFTTSLRVLDLSFIALVELPKSICELGELRHLNLNSTPIKMLPVEFGNLKKLKCLDLGYAWKLESIPNVAISQLSMLQSLNISNTGYQWNSDISLPLLRLEDLRELKNLEDLGVDVSSNSHLNTILGNKILFDKIAEICFKNIDFVKEDLQPIKVIKERLKILVVEQCALPGNILEIKDVCQLEVEHLYLWNLEISSVVIVNDCPFHGLEILQISTCGCLKEVSWTARLPSLKQFKVENCNGVQELVATGEEEIEEERDCYFPKLTKLLIHDTKNLQSIYGRNRPLLFPALKELSIQNCPKLKQLSLGRDSAKGIQIIKCTQSQWNLLEWEDDQVRARFLPYLRVPLQ